MNFNQEKHNVGLRIYTFSNNFYSNDENFINEAIKMYLSAYLSYNKDYLYQDGFTKQFINQIKNKPKEWNHVIKFSAKKITNDLIQLCVQNHPKITQDGLVQNKCDFLNIGLIIELENGN